MTPETIGAVLRESATIKLQLAATQAEVIHAAIGAVVATIAAGRAVFLFGNGGSAADAQHIAAELVGRFTRERRPLPALALTTDSSILTSIGNDYGFEQVFARQLLALGQPGDLAIAISTSGRSANVLQAVAAAQELGMQVIGMTGAEGGPLADRADLCLRVPSTDTARIQESHITLGHLLCQGVDEALASGRIPAVRVMDRPAG
jgi:D-sedoheptulose 7-phosphate isomerase